MSVSLWCRSNQTVCKGEAQQQQQQQHVNQQAQRQHLLLPQLQAHISHLQQEVLVDTLRGETGMKAGHEKMEIKFSREYSERVQSGGGCMPIREARNERE